MRFLNKKGISPLIATVLLIGFTVALAGVVITWGGGFVKNITEGTEERTANTLACAGDLNYDITKVNCDTSEVTIDNKGNLKLEKLSFRFFDATGDSLGSEILPAEGEVGPVIGAFEVKKVTMATGIPADTSKVEAIATIKVGEQDITCGDAVRSKSFTPACTGAAEEAA